MSQWSGGGRWLPLTVAGVCLVAIGVGLGAAVWRRTQPPPADAHAGMTMPSREETGTAATVPMPTPLPTTSAPTDAVVTLTEEMVARAGIKTVPATKGTAIIRLSVPGVVQPNGYKAVAVTSLVSGRITQVRAELGQRVTVGESLTTVYSPEVADAQTAFIAARSEQIAHGQRQTRTQRLFAIGAVSRQELEMLEADRARMEAAVETARTRLTLLGVPEERTQRLNSPADVLTTLDVRAPSAGVITSRSVNPGMNIDTATPLFTIVDLTNVWVIADLYERDFAKVRVGSPATITTASYPGLMMRGQVGYIDPQVQAETRTAKLRVEVGNAGGELRLGMYVDVSVGETSTGSVVFVPKIAVQVVGSQPVVYLAGHDRLGQFIERKVQVGDASGDRVPVLAGVEPGDLVVTEGAFFLRAERDRSSAAVSDAPPTGVAVPMR